MFLAGNFLLHCSFHAPARELTALPDITANIQKCLCVEERDSGGKGAGTFKFVYSIRIKFHIAKKKAPTGAFLRSCLCSGATEIHRNALHIVSGVFYFTMLAFIFFDIVLQCFHQAFGMLRGQ